MKRKRPPTTAADNGAPPEAAASLYAGSVIHARLKPVGHRFSYRVFNLLIDLDRLQEANRLSRLFSVGRLNLASFHEKDHGPRNGTSLRSHVDRLLFGAGVGERAERVLLLCYPRILGYVFNPLSVYYAYSAEGHLTALIYEVRNTFGDIHSYVEPVRPGQSGPEGVRQACDKSFFVSPFIEMKQRYRFRILPPGRSIRVRIMESDAEGPVLSATFAGNFGSLTSHNLLRLCASIPLLTFKVIAAIHFEAIKLWLKGVPFISPSTRKRGGSTARTKEIRSRTPLLPDEV
ncbi:DUF1365 family protein [Stappia sp. GBMRC 2046]|uniref:DUF1365 family protein n=1 Tax=Stappia sediminis TaxID=2692190 RepID=A0A7X3LSH4_9HYPH|nr:DUF1365 domain-containing protein [Stappia sediminis]MXN64295.1 DUF1365 family protein [Stappia sediminis]